MVGLWTVDGAGHSPAAAYAIAFALNLLPQCAALAWYFLAPYVAAARRPGLALDET